MRKVLWVLIVSGILPVYASAQTMSVPNADQYTLVAKAHYSDETYPYAGLENVDFTDGGSVIFAGTRRDTFSFQLMRFLPDGTEMILSPATGQGCTPLENGSQCQDENIFSGRMSSNEQYYYYIYRNLVSVNGNLVLSVYRLNDGGTEISTFYEFPENELPSTVTLNNNGDVVVTVQKIDGYQSVGMDLIRITRAGIRTTLESFPNYSSYPYATGSVSMHINDQGTVFVQQLQSPYNIYAFPNGGIVGEKKLIGQGVYHNFYTHAMQPGPATPASPEGSLYYVTDFGGRIVDSSGQTIFAVWDSVLKDLGVSILDFFITADGSVILWATNWNDKDYIVKNNEILVQTSQTIGTVTLSNLSDLRANSKGEFSFLAEDYTSPNHPKYIFKHGGEEAKKTCRVADVTGREVQFFAQGGGDWGPKPLGFHEQRADGRAVNVAHSMTMVGCVTTSMAMLFNYYGLNNVGKNPDGTEKEFNPYVMNEIFKSKRDLDGKNVVTYNSNNDVQYTVAAEAGRSIFQDQCFDELSLNDWFDPIREGRTCKRLSKSKISYKKLDSANYWGVITPDLSEIKKQAIHQKMDLAYKDIEKEICEGNPVMLRVAREKFKDGVTEYHGHTVLATATNYNDKGQLTFIVHDPSRTIDTMDITMEELADRDNAPKYNHFVGYYLFKQQDDPSMIEIYSSTNVDFVLTDSIGRRAGFDPVTNTNYEEIPGASYSEDSIGFAYEEYDESFKEFQKNAKHLIIAEDVQSGSYSIKVFGKSNGNGYVSINKTDVDGFSNDSEEHHFVIDAGAELRIDFKHSIDVLPDVSGDLKIRYALYNLSQESTSFSLHGLINRLLGLKKKNDSISIYGQMELFVGAKISKSDILKLTIGGSSDYKQQFSLNGFTRRTHRKELFFDYEKNNYKIILSENGQFWIDIKNIDLGTINRLKWGRITLELGPNVGRADLALACNNHICIQEHK